MSMKKKIYTRPVSVVLSDEMCEQILELTKQREIGVSDYVRDALTKALDNENKKDK
jgi:Arc/MetJ-type ribon-helix-helix transcriptional regulator